MQRGRKPRLVPRVRILVLARAPLPCTGLHVSTPCRHALLFDHDHPLPSPTPSAASYYSFLSIRKCSLGAARHALRQQHGCGCAGPSAWSKRPLAVRRACQRLIPHKQRARRTAAQQTTFAFSAPSELPHLPAPTLDQVTHARLYNRLVRTRLPPWSPSPAASPGRLQGRRGAPRITLARVHLPGG